MRHFIEHLLGVGDGPTSGIHGEDIVSEERGLRCGGCGGEDESVQLTRSL